MIKKLIWFVVATFCFFMILLTWLYFSPSFLTYNKTVKSDLLIIESWVPPFEMEQAIPLINSDSVNRVIIVGQDYSDNRTSIFGERKIHFRDSHLSEPGSLPGVWLLTNSSLGFEINNRDHHDIRDSLMIVVRARGSEAAGRFAHFNLVVNGKYAGGSFTTAKDSLYNFFLFCHQDESLQSVMISFDNDLVHQNLDRNLLIISLQVEDLLIEAREHNTFLIKNAGQYSNGFPSQADEKMNYLIHCGILHDKIIALAFTPVIKNQTLAGACALIDNPTFRKITSVNIVSSGLHSRRTWFTYQKIMGNDTNVGVLSFEQSDFRKGTPDGNQMRFKMMIDEAFSYFANWIYLTLVGT